MVTSFVSAWKLRVEGVEDGLTALLGDGAHLGMGQDQELVAPDAGDGDPADLVGVQAGLHELTELLGRLHRPAETLAAIPAGVPDLGADDRRAEHAHADAVACELAPHDVAQAEDG